jgi:hypothetical protein
MLRALNGFLILVLAIDFGTTLSVVHADDQFKLLIVNGHNRYIVPAAYAQKPVSFVRRQLADALTREQNRKGVAFWTPTPLQSLQAEVAVHKFILESVHQTTLAFPDIDQWKGNPRAMEQAAKELERVKRDYEKYVGQFVGIVIDQKKYIYCSYFSRSQLQNSVLMHR